MFCCRVQNGALVRSWEETASSRCHACRQIESSSNCFPSSHFDIISGVPSYHEIEYFHQKFFSASLRELPVKECIIGNRYWTHVGQSIKSWVGLQQKLTHRLPSAYYVLSFQLTKVFKVFRFTSLTSYVKQKSENICKSHDGWLFVCCSKLIWK